MPDTFSKTFPSGIKVKYQDLHGVEYPVFASRTDFEAHFMFTDGACPPLVEWQKAVINDWVEADDGGVVQILSCQNLHQESEKKRIPWCRTIVGSFTQNQYGYMDTDFDNHPSRYCFKKNSSQGLRKSKKLTDKDRAFCLVLATAGIKTIEDAERIYSRIYRGHRGNVREKLIELLAERTIMDEIKENLQGLAIELGITPRFLLKNIRDLTTTSKRDDVKLNANIKLIELLRYDDVENGIGGLPAHNQPGQVGTSPFSVVTENAQDGDFSESNTENDLNDASVGNTEIENLNIENSEINESKVNNIELVNEEKVPVGDWKNGL